MKRKIIFFVFLHFKLFTIIPNLNLSDLKDRILIKTDHIEPGSIVFNLNIGVANLSKDFTKSTLQTQIKSIFEESKSYLSTTTNFVYDNRLFLTLGSLSTIYASLVYKIISTNRLLNNLNYWHAWKSEIPYDKLINTTQSDLAKDLLIKINQKFEESKSHSLNSDIFSNFINEINFEIYQFQSYLNIVKWLKVLCISKVICKYNTQTTELVEEKIKRLQYFKNLFLSNLVTNCVLNNKN